MVRNVHERRLRARPERVGALLDCLAGQDDKLWPTPAWPPLRLDRPVQVGAAGGHGPIRYVVEAHVPGTMVRFRFDPSIGAEGTHTFIVLPDGGGSVLRHELEAKTTGRMRLAWPLAVRWLHDALLEDLLDRAQAEVDGAVPEPARWSPWVRLLRAVAGPASAGRSASGNDGGRRPLQVVLGVLACIPLASGLAGVLVGPSALPRSTGEVGASLDSEYRFTNAYWLALAPVIWSTLPRVERSTGILRAALGATFAGGLARLLAWRRSGAPHPTLAAALGLELVGVPVLLVWQRHVARACLPRQVPVRNPLPDRRTRRTMALSEDDRT